MWIWGRRHLLPHLEAWHRGLLAGGPDQKAATRWPTHLGAGGQAPGQGEYGPVSPTVPFDALTAGRLPGDQTRHLPARGAVLAIVPVPRLLAEREINPPRGACAAAGGRRGLPGRAAQRGRMERIARDTAQVKAIADLFGRSFPRNADGLSGREATSAAVRGACCRDTAWRHLATHGFFAPKELRSALSRTPRGRRGCSARRAWSAGTLAC